MSVNIFTKNLMAKFPSWMKLAKDELSVGAQFLDVFGITLEQFQKELEEITNGFYIGTMDMDMIDIIYKIPLASETIDDMELYTSIYIETNEGNHIPVTNCPNIRQFYRIDSSNLFRAYLDRENGYLYLRVDLDAFEDINQPFKAVVINGAPQYELILHHVWNALDEMGLLLNLKRLFGEKNEDYKKRILDVFINPGNSTHDGMVNGISRELGISKEEVKINSLPQYAFDNELLDSHHQPTKKMIGYAKQINSALKFTWDSMNFGEAYWHSISEDNLGINFLPHLWDVDMSMWEDKDFQSGIGDGDDLLVHKPISENPIRKFKTYISLIGYYEDVEEIYPEIKFRYKIYAKGKVPNTEYLPEEFRYTLKSTRIVNQSYNLEAEQNFKYNFRTDFYDKNKFVNNTQMDFISSDDCLHDEEDKVVRLKVKMDTYTDTDSPSYDNLTITYEDNQGNLHDYVINKRDEFLNVKNSTNGKILTDVYSGRIYAEDKKLELGYGAFQKIIDSTADWQSGTYDTKSILIKDGNLQLNLDLTGKTMN